MEPSGRRLLQHSRRAAGLSQVALADLAGVPRPTVTRVESGANDTTTGTLDRLIGAAGYRLIAVPDVGPTVAEASLKIAGAIAEGNESLARAEFFACNEVLHAAGLHATLVLTFAPAVPTGALRWDAAIAALAHHHHRRFHAPPPPWVSAAPKLDVPWRLSDAEIVDGVPRAFKNRNVIVSYDDLDA